MLIGRSVSRQRDVPIYRDVLCMRHPRCMHMLVAHRCPVIKGKNKQTNRTLKVSMAWAGLDASFCVPIVHTLELSISLSLNRFRSVSYPSCIVLFRPFSLQLQFLIILSQSTRYALLCWIPRRRILSSFFLFFFCASLSSTSCFRGLLPCWALPRLISSYPGNARWDSYLQKNHPISYPPPCLRS